MYHIVIANIKPVAVSRTRHTLAHSQAQNIAIKIAQLVHRLAIGAKINVVNFSEWHFTLSG
jgi:hypothetical protein